jgi:hypothetical protein
MKVRTDYSDGHYDVIGATPEDCSRGWKHTIEVSDEEWRLYCAHVEECRKWHRWASSLSNEEFAQTNPDYPFTDEDRAERAKLVQQIVNPNQEKPETLLDSMTQRALAAEAALINATRRRREALLALDEIVNPKQENTP